MSDDVVAFILLAVVESVNLVVGAATTSEPANFSHWDSLAFDFDFSRSCIIRFWNDDVQDAVFEFGDRLVFVD